MSNPQIDEWVKQYVQVRDALTEERRQFKEKETQYKDVMDRIATRIHLIAKELGTTSFKTQYGTAFEATKDWVKVNNWDAFMAWAIEHDMTQMFTKSAAKDAVKEYMEANEGVLPPGLEYGKLKEIQVRAK